MRTRFDADGAWIDLPPAGVGFRSLGILLGAGFFAGVTLLVLWHSGLWDPPGKWPERDWFDWLFPAVPGLMGIAAVMSAVITMVSAETVVVDRAGVTVHRRFGPFRRTLRRVAGEVQEVAFHRPEPFNGIDLSPPPRQLNVRTKHGPLLLGRMLDTDERAWLRDTLVHYLAGGDGVVQERAAEPDAAPAPASAAFPAVDAAAAAGAPDCPYQIRGETLVFPPDRSPRLAPRFSLGCLIVLAPLIVIPLLAGVIATAPEDAVWQPLPRWAWWVMLGLWAAARLVERAARRCTYELDRRTETGTLRFPVAIFPARVKLPFRKIRLRLASVLGADGPRFRLVLAGGAQGVLYESDDVAAALRIARAVAGFTRLPLQIPPVPHATDASGRAHPAVETEVADPGDDGYRALGYRRFEHRLVTSSGTRFGSSIPSLGCTGSGTMAGCGLVLGIAAGAALLFTFLGVAGSPAKSGAPVGLFWIAVTVACWAVVLVFVGLRRRTLVIDFATGEVRARWTAGFLRWTTRYRLEQFDGVGITSAAEDSGTRFYLVRLHGRSNVAFDLEKRYGTALDRARAVAHFCGLPVLNEWVALGRLIEAAREE